MADDVKRVEVLFGPYAGHILTMETADADAAVSAQWALDPPRELPVDPNAPPLPDLTPEERQAAEDAANAWAAAARGEPDDPKPEPIEPEPEQPAGKRVRDLGANDPASYRRK